MRLIETNNLDLDSLELPVLLDMLSEQTSAYIRLIKEERFSARSNEARQAVIRIQLAIQNKKANKESMVIPFNSFPNSQQRQSSHSA